MTSRKKIEANRRNAKKSTGPKTEEGKAKSSMNAYKHGLTSQRVWLDEEEEMDFREFRRGLLDELMPIGSLETQFVCRIAAQMWRLARVPGIEAELLCKLHYDFVDGANTGLGEAFHKDIGTYDGSLGRLARYEAILERSLTRLLNEYRKIQADRIKREKRHAEDWARAGLPPHDIHADYDGLPPHSLAKTEANYDEPIIEDIAAEETALTATGPSQAAEPRKRRDRQAVKKAKQGKKAKHGGNGIDKSTARRMIPRPDGWEPRLGT